MTGLQLKKKCSGFFKRDRKKNAPHFALTGRRYSRVCTIFRAQNRRSDLRLFNIKAENCEKTGSCTKTKSFKEKNVSYSLLRSKVQTSIPFLRDGRWHFAHVFYMPIPRPALFFFFSSPKVFGLRRSNFSKNLKLTKNQGQKDENRHVKSL